jgi:membrane-associated protein
MDLITGFIDIFLHLDDHLAAVIEVYGVWTYAILFLIIFAETGLVVTPFLPGDSLLFAAGAFAARGSLSLALLFLLLSIAAIAGDTVNYWVGKYLGARLS